MTAREVLLAHYSEFGFARLCRIWRACDLPPMDSLPLLRAVSIAVDLGLAIDVWSENADGISEVDGAIQRIAAELIDKAAASKAAGS